METEAAKMVMLDRVQDLIGQELEGLNKDADRFIKDERTRERMTDSIAQATEHLQGRVAAVFEGTEASSKRANRGSPLEGASQDQEGSAASGQRHSDADMAPRRAMHINGRMRALKREPSNLAKISEAKMPKDIELPSKRLPRKATNLRAIVGSGAGLREEDSSEAEDEDFASSELSESSSDADESDDAQAIQEDSDA